MKTLVLLMLSILLLGCGAQSMRSYQGKPHNTQGNPKFGYKFNPKDTVVNNYIGAVYVIDSVHPTKANLLGFGKGWHSKSERFYYATDIHTKNKFQWLAESTVVKI